MKFKWVILFLVFVIGSTSAKNEKKKNNNGGSLTHRNKVNATITKCFKQQKVNQNKKKRKEAYKQLAEKCGCTKEDRCLLFQNKQPVKCACLMKDYDATEAPGDGDVTKVYSTFIEQNVLEVDETEKKKSVRLDMKIVYMWEDNGIKTKFGKNEKCLV